MNNKRFSQEIKKNLLLVMGGAITGFGVVFMLTELPQIIASQLSLELFRAKQIVHIVFDAGLVIGVLYLIRSAWGE